jgi:hypothetical protein
MAAACVRTLGTSCIPSRSRSRANANRGPQVNEILDSIPLSERRSAIELAASISSATAAADRLKNLRKDYRAKQKKGLKHLWYLPHWHTHGKRDATCSKPLQGRLKHNRSFQNHKRDLETTLVEAKSKIETVKAEGRAGAALLDTQEATQLRKKRLYQKAKGDR